MLPVTDEVLLVEDGSVGAEEGVGEQATVHVPQGTYVERLAQTNYSGACVPYVLLQDTSNGQKAMHAEEHGLLIARNAV